MSSYVMLLVPTGDTEWTYRVDIQDGRTGWIYRVYIQGGYTGWTYRTEIHGCGTTIDTDDKVFFFVSYFLFCFVLSLSVDSSIQISLPVLPYFT
jgi:hypothetical protein